MGLKDMLEKRTDDLVHASHGEGNASEARRGRTVTAPGALFGLREEMGRNEARVAELELTLEQFDGALPTRKLDPRQVQASKWANRHASSFEGREFASLKLDIEAAGGNVQPIKVRPQEAGKGSQYEIVYGHRRHRACLELGVEVLAIVSSVDDVQLFSEMDRENREREDLRPYELGMHYKRALDAKLWPTQAQLAAALGITPAYVSQVLSIAELPKYVIECFPSPIDIQVRWGVELGKRVAAEPERVKAVAASLRKDGEKRLAGQVFVALMETGNSQQSKDIVVGGKKVATLKSSGDRVSVAFEKGIIGPAKRTSLEKVLKEFLSRSK